MRRFILLITALTAVMAFTLSAGATEDLGDGRCIQTDGQPGWFDGTTPDDAGCITQDEYVAMTSPEGLLDSGVIESFTDNGDGTVILNFGVGQTTVEADPLDRIVSANPELEPDAPTVREFLFSDHPGNGGPQEY